jgi:hypothetical protein
MVETNNALEAFGFKIEQTLGDFDQAKAWWGNDHPEDNDTAEVETEDDDTEVPLTEEEIAAAKLAEELAEAELAAAKLAEDLAKAELAEELAKAELAKAELEELTLLQDAINHSNDGRTYSSVFRSLGNSALD